MPLTNLWEEKPSKIKEEIANLVELLAMYLTTLLNDHSKIPMRYTLFHSGSIPSMPIKSYLMRYVKYLCLDETDLIIMLSIMDKYIKKYPEYPLTMLNIHKLIAASFQIGHKFYDDMFQKSSIYAKIAGLSCKEMNELERELLFKLEFDLWIDSTTYVEYKQLLVNFARKQEVTPEVSILRFMPPGATF